ncbi:4-carboxy-2-hydroxymuconate-6-semialdehyde dehydrogenase [Microbacterium oxydans]|uniref:Gfo/Idh/MocA family protein n=1 Tax=Microbacterium oxydans TaxID=82380 RepID=UPI001D4036FF|nr:Gfo/Idh/MocA family oxidoreductase [Microbacterium oxydans]CAH0193483.1 4-carboxy-2-hydroxymuconate-6-semialdehyde dehydrogenase [Microbacterium oxydans]
MRRWGVVGTGDISDRLVEDLLGSGGVIACVWGRTPERAGDFASRHSIPFATADLPTLLARDDIDVVYIATPAHTHTAIALEALDAGKHVLVEKPMATSAADVELLFARAAAADRFLMEAMWMRFNPLHVEVIDRIGAGELGSVSSVRAGFGTPFFPRPGKARPEDGGSILRDRGIYPVTLAHWFLGAPQAVSARGVVSEGVDLAGHAVLEHTDGGFAQLAWSGVEFLDLSASISGERGWITLDPMFWAGSDARVHAGSAERIFREPELVRHPRVGNGYGPMLEAVSAAIDAGLREHPWHDAATTISITSTLDRILAEISAT